MQRKWVQWLLVLVVLVMAGTLRVHDLKDLPAGLFCDEAAEGYNAYAIGTYGIDENGKQFPLFIWSFGGYKNPIYIYTAAAIVRVFGLDEFTTRLPAALFGVGGVIAIFLLGRVLFGPWVGLISAILLAFCPWHLHFSRIAFDMTLYAMLFMFGVTLLVRFTQGRRTLPAAMLFFGACVYAYAIATLFVPLFLVGFGLLYLPTLLRHWRQTLLAIVVAAATVAPAGIFYFRNMQAGGRYFQNTTVLKSTDPLMPQIERLKSNYLEFFSSSFLFQRGDPITRHHVRGFGELLPLSLPDRLVGALGLAKDAAKWPELRYLSLLFIILGAVVSLAWPGRAPKLVLWWLVLYPLGASLMTEIPSATRAFIGVPAFCLLAAIGLTAILRALGAAGYWRPVGFALQAAALAGVLALFVPEARRYLEHYFFEYARYSAPTYGGFQYGYRDSIQFMEPLRKDYDLMMITATEVNQPQIFPLFYNRMDPRDWSRNHQLGYLISDPAFYADYHLNQRVLYQLQEQDLAYFDDYTIKKRVMAPGGQVAFLLGEVRKRKQFLTHWLALGLFDNTEHRGERTEFIDVQHLTKDRYRGEFGDVYWSPIQQRNVKVDLNGFFALKDPRYPGNPEWDCAYAVTTVLSPAARHAFLELTGSGDPMTVWLNGRLLTAGPRIVGDTAQRREIELGAGPNLLLVKSCEGIGAWHFTARITDEKGVDIPDLTVSAEIPDSVVSAPPPEPDLETQLVEGFQSVLRFAHTDPHYGDYRGGTNSYWAYVHDAQGEVVWQAAPCPERKNTLVVFTASTSPENGSAELFIDGKYALTFTIGEDGVNKQWKREGYALSFISKGSFAGNSGIMVLTVPASVVTPGQPLELRVVPTGGTPHAWFMVKDYRDTTTHEGLSVDAVHELLQSAWESSGP